MKLLCVLSLCLFFQLSIYGQIAENEVIGRIYEDMVDEDNDALELDQLIEVLQAYIVSPLNLNSATLSDLEGLLFLTDEQISNLLAYRAQYGQIYSPYELRCVDGFERRVIENLMHFVFLGDLKPKVHYARPRNNGLIMRYQRILEEARGYQERSLNERLENPNGQYNGDRNKLYVRFQESFSANVWGGFVAEKDAGERFFGGENKRGFDFYTGFIQVEKIWGLSRLIVGDYQAQFGQGLICSSGYSMGKTSLVLNVRRKEKGLQRSLSTDENNFFRGVSACWDVGLWRASTFASYKNMDASLEIDQETGVELLTSWQATGLHRTVNEIAKEDAVSQFVIGSNLKRFGSMWNIGFTGVYYRNSVAFAQKKELIYAFNESKSSNANIGLDYDWRTNQFRFFGEFGLSANGSLAMQHAGVFTLNKNVSFAALYRNYPRNYQAMFANAFREGSRVQNENGLYFGWDIHPFPYWHITGYVDAFRYDWLRYRVNAPSNGYEGFAELSYQASDRFAFAARYKLEQKGENQTTENSSIAKVVLKRKTGLRMQVSFTPSRQLTLRTRVECALYNKAGSEEFGNMIFQDIQYNWKSCPLSLRFRFAFFETTYNTRVYAYENDLLYVFSVPAYYGQGYRTYLVLSYKPTDQLSFWIKLGTFKLSDRTHLGSGLDELPGNRRSELKVQVRYKISHKQSKVRYLAPLQF